MDITPPPGLGLQGYGLEGLEARGYRQRLYARVLALEDSTGERVAVVVADLQAISPNIHRHVARKLAQDHPSVRIGPDRLLLAATHTHAAPSHYNAEAVFNENASSIPGYDEHVAQFLADRITEGIVRAFDRQRFRPAKAAWGTRVVRGVTRNRSYEAYLRNRGSVPPGFPASVTEAVNQRWTMLRVDTLSSERDIYAPAGALSVFGIHSTVNPIANDLYDGDIHAYVSRAVEAFIDSLTAGPPSVDDPDPRPSSVHLLANGAEGDVSPAWSPESRCDPPWLDRALRPGGARAPRGADEWRRISPERRAVCLTAARNDMIRIGTAMARVANGLFQDLAQRLADTLTLSRAFVAFDLRGHTTASGTTLPADPMVGSALLGGGEDGRTRFYGWRDFGIFPAGFEEGIEATDPKNPDPLQRPKRKAAPAIYSVIVGEGLPFSTQLMVVRLGDMFVAAVPTEVTTVAAFRMRRAVIQAARQRGHSGADATLLGLANGYLLYTTTAEEYMMQHYEGGATLYGHQTAVVFEEELARLTESVVSGAPVVDVGPILQKPGESKAMMPQRSEPSPAARAITRSGCRGDTVIVRWRDAHPGSLVPADGLVLEFTRSGPGGVVTAWDDDVAVEVRAIGSRAGGGYEWEARWLPPPVTGVDHTFALLPRRGHSDGARSYPAVGPVSFTCRP